MTLDDMITLFASITDVPEWALLDSRNRNRHTVRRRRHLIFYLTVTETVPIKQVAARFNIDRSTVWRSVKHHKTALRHWPKWAAECTRVDTLMRGEL